MAYYPNHPARYRGGNTALSSLHPRCERCFGPLDADGGCNDLDCLNRRPGAAPASPGAELGSAEGVGKAYGTMSCPMCGGPIDDDGHCFDQWEHCGGPLPPMQEQSVFSPSPSIREITNQQAKLVDDALALVRSELLQAMVKHGPMHSMHEAYGVIIEEVDEFFDEVKQVKANSTTDPAWVRARKELRQVAAMAIRAMVDLG